MSDKPPHDLDAEEAVCASILVDDSALDRVESLVNAADFLNENCRVCFIAARELGKRNESTNEVTVAHEIARSGGGADLAFLSRIVSELPTPVGVEHYAQIVHRDGRYRRAIQAGSKIVEEAYKGGADIDAFLAKCEGLITGLQEDGEAQFSGIRKLLEDFWEEPGVNRRITRMARTGLGDLDKILAGVQPSDLVIVAAQTGHGKSHFLVNLARNAAVGQNFRVAIMSLEMSEAQLRTRLLARESGIAIDRLRLGSMNEDEERRAMDATGLLSGLTIEIHDRAMMTIEQMRGQLRRLSARLGGLDLVLVDYLQLIGNHRRFENRTAEVGAISRGLKMLARELDVPIVAAAQLSREVDKRDTRIPRLSDLRESGSIEQDADVVIFLYRQDKHDEKAPAGLVRLIVAKHRNGQTGHCFARMNDATALLEDLAPVQEAPWAR